MSNQNVRVVCRFRPQNSKEEDKGGKVIVEVNPEQTSVKISGSESNHDFTFDRIFPPSSTQKEVYEYAAKPVVEDILKGYNGTIFVYGQTSSGKTHTMQGPSIHDPEQQGIIPRMNGTIFEGVMSADENIEFLVKASYIEIYMEKIRDLLDSTKQHLQVREEKSKGIWVEGATEYYVSSEQDVLNIIEVGSSNRAIAETKMNTESSRSHSIFILTVQQRHLIDLSNKTGKLYLVDLAGSEKVEKTGAQGTTLDEAKTINKSLSALGNVINALTDGKSTHVPYRDSKLTRVLQESLGGNSRTTLIINCSPSSFNEAETLSTLRFGNRAKNIKNAAKINQERSVAELKLLLAAAEKQINTLQATITSLQQEVKIYRSGGVPAESGSTAEGISLTDVQERCIELENQLRIMNEEKQQATEIHESILEELREKDQDVESLRDELEQAHAAEKTLAKENEFLIVKLADMTIANEKMQFDNNEMKVTVDSLQAQLGSSREQLEEMRNQMQTLNERRSDGNGAETSSTKDSNGWSEKVDETVSKAIAKEKERRKSFGITEAQQIIAALRLENQTQKTEIQLLQKEKEMQQANLEQLREEYENRQVQAIEASDSTPSEDKQRLAKLERELKLVKEQANQQLIEFDLLKASLLKDLENRCKKVIELEILLDEARDLYQSVLAQVKNANNKSLQQKNIYLQRNLEQLTLVQQQLVKENTELKQANAAQTKKLAIRNERINGLELLLQEAQEKLQKHASGDVPPSPQPTQGGPLAKGKKATLPPTVVTSGGRIATPLRGGGKGPTGAPTPDAAAQLPRTPEKAKSIWDIFRGSSKSRSTLLPDSELGPTTNTEKN